MKTFKTLFLVLILLSSVSVFGQINFEIFSTTVSTQYDSKGDLESTRIWASGVRGEDILNVDVRINTKKQIIELMVNDQNIIKPRFGEYQELVNVIVKYVENELQPSPKSNDVTPGPAPEQQLSEDDRRRIAEFIRSELLADTLIDDPEVFDFLLTGDSLYVNAKKQPKNMFIKYKEIYEEYATIPLTPTTFFQLTQSR